MRFQRLWKVHCRNHKPLTLNSILRQLTRVSNFATYRQLSQIRFNLIFTYTNGPTKWHLSFMIVDQNFLSPPFVLHNRQTGVYWQSKPKDCVIFNIRYQFSYSERLVPPKLHNVEDRPLSAIRDYFLSILASTFHIYNTSTRNLSTHHLVLTRTQLILSTN